MTSRAAPSDIPAIRPEDPVTRLKGIGPRTAEALAVDGIRTILDLLLHLPRRYEDRSNLTLLDRRPAEGSWVLIRGIVRGARMRRISRRRLHIVDGLIEDGHGLLPVVWFNQRWLDRRLTSDAELYLYGRVRERAAFLEQVLEERLDYDSASPAPRP